MIDELIQAIDWNNLGVMAGFVLITFMITRFFQPFIAAYIANGREANNIQRATNAILTRLENKIDADQRVTTSLTDTITSLTGVVRDLKLEMVTASATMHQRASERDKKLVSMHTDIQTVPAEVWRLGDPKLGAIQTMIEQLLNGMETRLFDRIDPDALNARMAVKTEFAIIKAHFQDNLDQMVTRLNEIDNTLKALDRMKKPTTDDLTDAAEKAVQKAINNNRSDDDGTE